MRREKCSSLRRTMPEVLGKPVRFQQTSKEAYKASLAAFGSEAMVQGMADMAAAKNEGLDNEEPWTPRASTPTSFRQRCEEVLKLRSAAVAMGIRSTLDGSAGGPPAPLSLPSEGFAGPPRDLSTCCPEPGGNRLRA